MDFKTFMSTLQLTFDQVKTNNCLTEQRTPLQFSEWKRFQTINSLIDIFLKGFDLPLWKRISVDTCNMSKFGKEKTMST